MNRARLAAFYTITKPRIAYMVLVTTVWGFFLGYRGGLIAMLADPVFWATMLGTGLAAGGAAALNQYLERDIDGIMRRTRNRPLPAGLMDPGTALAYGLWLTVAGVGLLLWQVHLLAAFLALLTNFLYVLVYTPMKRISTLNTTFGAIPGAMPPLIGWAAAHGSITTEGFALFLILFVWQHPHVYAISWMCRADHARAGLRMLSVDGNVARTSRYVIASTLALMAVSILPAVLGMSNGIYLLVVLLTGAALLRSGLSMRARGTTESAKQVMKVTLVYLPLLLAALLLDAVL